MSLHTGIEWCDSTANPAMGCDGCELWNEATGVKVCYAGTLTERYGGHSKGYPAKFTEPKLFPERIAKMLRWSDLTGTDREDKPWLNGYPRIIFLGDMGDNFTESLPVDWMMPYVAQMAASPHIHTILTKRPGRMREFWSMWCHGSSPYRKSFRPIPPNFWFLTSVTGPENKNRIVELLKLRALGASVLGVSYEPAWGEVDFRPFLPQWIGLNEMAAAAGPALNEDCSELWRPGLDWVIGGGQSGAGADPSHPQWFRDARDACQAAGAAFFFKQWGEYAPLSRTDGFHELPFGNYNVTSRFGFLKQGKKNSGALLDGREWRQMPPVLRIERSLQSPGSLISKASTEARTTPKESL